MRSARPFVSGALGGNVNRVRQDLGIAMISREPASLILAWGGWIMLTSRVHPLQIAGVVFTVALLALAWASRGRLNSMGFEFLHWNRTSARENTEALGFGAVCGLAVALRFQALYKGTPLKWQDAFIGSTLGPLLEEAVFRG
jgi:hypothetical protein